MAAVETQAPSLAIAPGTWQTIAFIDPQAPFNGESTARVSYLAFAAKADEVGYGPVASLFGAAARAADIQARNHTRVITGMGAMPVAKIEPPAVKSTRENLQMVMKGLYENEEMYPAFLKQAREESNDQLSTRSTGFTAAKVDFDLCPVCSTPTE